MIFFHVFLSGMGRMFFCWKIALLGSWMNVVLKCFGGFVRLC